MAPNDGLAGSSMDLWSLRQHYGKQQRLALRSKDGDGLSLSGLRAAYLL
jgi:hypothetical protein